jgi:transcriptional regulator with XRE-family HTH domain
MTIGHIKASELLRIGDSIRILRKNKGWTQKKLTSALGVEIDFFTRMENIQYGRNQ